MEPAPEGTGGLFQGMASQESFSRTQDFSSGLGTHSTQKINDMSSNQLISDPSTYVKKRTQRSDDLILLRHIDDVVGTGPSEQFMSDSEHMKTSLYLTDVVVLRDERRHCQLFLVLTSPRQAGASRWKNHTDIVESLLKSLRVGKLETDSRIQLDVRQ